MNSSVPSILGRAVCLRDHTVVDALAPGDRSSFPCILAFMRLSEVLAAHVSSSSRSRGLSYFESGAVTSLERDGSTLRATVVGNDDYDVRVAPAGARLRVACTCPHFVDQLQICK